MLCRASPAHCHNYDWMYSGLAAWPPHAFSWQAWQALAVATGAQGVAWVLNPFAMPPAASVAQLRALAQLGRAGDVFELGNELYDLNGYASRIQSVEQYLALVQPILQGTADVPVAKAVVACPCDMFWAPSAGCWGGGYYQQWNANLSRTRTAACATSPVHPLCFDSVTAHNYRLNLADLEAYSASADAMTLAFLTYSEATTLNAVERMAAYFPNATLYLTENNVFYPDGWGNTSSPAASFLRASYHSGLHALYVASGLMAALAHSPLVGSFHYHGLLQGCSKPSGCDPLASQPGFGIVSLDTPGQTTVSAVAQVYAHLSAVARQATAVAPVTLSTGPTLNATFADRPDMPALQALAFFMPANATTLVVLNRWAAAPVQAQVTGLPPCSSSGSSLTVHTVAYEAADPGGWAAMPSDPTHFPWPGPLRPTSATASATVAADGSVSLPPLPAQALYFIELACQ